MVWKILKLQQGKNFKANIRNESKKRVELAERAATEQAKKQMKKGSMINQLKGHQKRAKEGDLYATGNFDC